HALQFIASLLLGMSARSAGLMSFGLDAVVSAVARLVLAARIPKEWRHRSVAYGYMVASAGAFYLGASMFWTGSRPQPSALGILVAAVSMLVIPIVGSFMKILAVGLRIPAFNSAALF